MTIRLYILLLSALTASAAILPPDRSFPWHDSVGVEGGIPDSSNMTVNVTIPTGANGTLQAINTAIANCPSNRVVQLSAGTYTLGGSIVMKSGVVLRGAGMSNTIVVFTGGGISSATSDFYNTLRDNPANYGGGSANWTSGYSHGESNVVLSSTSGLTVGNVLFLDQNDDTFYVNHNGYEGSGGYPVSQNRCMCQLTEVQAINGTTVTIWPPVASTWVVSGLSPKATWMGASHWASKVGIENLTIDCTTSGGAGNYQANIDFEAVRNCWVKGIKSIKANKDHIYFGWGTFRCTARDSYFYYTQNAAQQSYGIELDIESGVLVENNVFEGITASFVPHVGASANAYLYNYCTNDYYTASPDPYLMAAIQPHDCHVYMELYEGNHLPKYDSDYIHGSHSHEVLFRNRITGWEAYQYPGTETTRNRQCESFQLTNRYCSSVGNILGTTGKYNSYEAYPGHTGSGTNIYEFGLKNNQYAVAANWTNDLTTFTTFYRHMDYDVVTAGITYNPTNADVTLPASLFYTSKPAYFGNLNWPPFNPTNTTLAQMDPTNLPAGYWKVFGANPPTDSGVAPVIDTQPIGLTNGAGATAYPVFGSHGDAPITHFLITNGVLAVKDTVLGNINIPNLLTNWDQSTFYIVASNTVGTATFNTNTITVFAFPQITAQATNWVGIVGGSATNSVTAISYPATFYTWKSNGIPVVVGTSNYIILNSLSASGNNSVWTCTVSNLYAQVIGGSVILTVNAGTTNATILQQPTNYLSAVGATAHFNIQMAGSQPFMYIWMESYIYTTNSNMGLLDIPSVTTAMDGSNIFCRITNSTTGDSGLSSAGARLNVYQTPVIDTQPTNWYGTLYDVATNSVVAHGYPTPLLYDWQRNFGGSWSGNLGPRADQATYRQILIEPTLDQTQWRVVVSDPTYGNSVTSSVVTLALTQPGDPPQAGWSLTTTNGRVPIITLFSDQTVGSPDKEFINFGDGTSINGVAPMPVAHIYWNAGTYSASLIASNAIGSTAVTNIITVNPFLLRFGAYHP